MDALWQSLIDAKGIDTLPVGVERRLLWERYQELQDLSHKLNAARGRRKWKSIYGEWPHFLSE
jgi:hypothetical protein